MSIKQIIASPDAVDTVTLDVPLLIRLLEHAREDLKTDAELHVFTTQILGLSKSTDVLTMQQWPAIMSYKQNAAST